VILRVVTSCQWSLSCIIFINQDTINKPVTNITYTVDRGEKERYDLKKKLFGEPWSISVV
jgi:hypothetical protein